jgi:peptide/nickel transport system ATP-binding protein
VSAPLLQVDGLHVWFELPDGGELHAVRGVDFALSERERFGLVGESGCGKTTTILALMGLLPPTASVAGRVLLDGEDLLAGGERGMRAHRWKDVAMVFQGAMNAFSPVTRIGDQIVEPMELHGIASGKAARTRAGELLELVGIRADRADRYPHEFSGGMRQRAAIAMALACGPKVLLADEPTTALDAMTQAQILALLERLTDELGLALVLVTHDLPIIAHTCPRAAVMYAGEIAEQGPTEALYHDPRHPYTRLLFSATPDIQGSERTVAIPGAPPRLDHEPAGCPFAPRCDRAFEPCAGVVPERVEIAPGHAARCHLNTTPGVAPAREPGASEAHDPAIAARRALAAAGPVPTHEREADAPLLEVEDLVVHYALKRGIAGTVARRPRTAVCAVDGVSLRVGPGEMVALVGESGCGKTTTAQTIMRMIEPAGGSIRVLGDDVTRLDHRRMRPVRRRMQVIFQDPFESLDPRFRVRETVEEPLLVHRVLTTAEERRERVEEALTRAGLTPPSLYMDRYPHELSGGQRQRVAIAAALAVEPDVLVADEPASMLDVSVRAGVLALLDELRRAGLGILMITHDLATAAQYANRIAVMYLGRIVEEGPAREVVAAPRHPYTQALISVVPSPDPREQVRPEILKGETPNPAFVPSGCRFHPRCPVALESCSAHDPALRRVAGEHRAACVLVDGVDDDAPGAAPAASAASATEPASDAPAPEPKAGAR